MTEDRDGDIPAILGRSDSRNNVPAVPDNKTKRDCRKELPIYLKYHHNNSLSQVVNRIKNKMKKDYGSNVALVVRDVSGCDWDWDMHARNVRELLDLDNNPFDKGIWIISRAKDRVFNIV
jgi:hypothetical protein